MAMANLNRERKRLDDPDGEREQKPGRWFLPSQRKPKYRFKIPEGMVSLFPVRSWNGKASASLGVFLKEDEAYKLADSLQVKAKAEHRNIRFTVEHKAGYIAPDGRVYAVNLVSIKLNDTTLATTLTPTSTLPHRWPFMAASSEARNTVELQEPIPETPALVDCGECATGCYGRCMRALMADQKSKD
jgi:hypothetical protein